jgi:hypothetical protein
MGAEGVASIPNDMCYMSGPRIHMFLAHPRHTLRRPPPHICSSHFPIPRQLPPCIRAQCDPNSRNHHRPRYLGEEVRRVLR